MYDTEVYRREQERTLTFPEKLKILDQLDAFGKKYGFTFKHFVLIGGDPLLADDVFDLVEELRRRGKTVAFAGNPETLTDENCKKLKKYGIRSFQLSLDGLEQTHDSIRGKGSFKRTIAGYEQLDKYGILTTTMLTLSDLNVNEFFDLIDYVFYHTKSKGMAFDFCTQIGNAKNIGLNISPEFALDFSNRYLEVKKTKEKERSDFHFGEKLGFIRLLHMQRNDFCVLENGTTNFIAGCLIGCRCQCIMSDGTLVLCRRLPQILGRLPEDSFEEIYLTNESIKKYRRPQFFEDCGNCVGWNWCRGCPAISDTESGDPFKKPTTCYAHLLDIDTCIEHKPISMQTTLEEATLIKNTTRHEYFNLRYGLRLPFKVIRAIHKLRQPQNKKLFNENPSEWFLLHAPKLNSNEQNLVLFHFNKNALGFIRTTHRGPRWPT